MTKNKVDTPSAADGVSKKVIRNEFDRSPFLLDLFLEVVSAYTFWSLFHGLPPMIWFYPLNELDITGYEAFVVAMLSPALAIIPGVTTLLRNRYAVALLRLVSVASLASFQAPSTLSRLGILAVGMAASLLLVVSQVWGASKYKSYVSMLGLLLGYVVLLVSRIWFVSVLPTWSDFTTNKIVTSIAAAAVVYQIFTTFRISENTAATKPIMKNNTNHSWKKGSPWLRIGLALGSHLYLVHLVFGDVSVPCRWVVEGFPGSGPLPNPSGAFILMAIIVGILLSHNAPYLSYSYIWWLVGAAAFAALLYLPGFLGLAGAAVLALYTFSTWPSLWSAAAVCPPGLVLGVAMLTYVVQIFFSVWTVAYNFVPGGEFTRERTDLLVLAVMLCLALTLTTDRLDQRNRSHLVPDVRSSQRHLAPIIKSVLMVLMAVGLLSFATRWQKQHSNLSTLIQERDSPREFGALIWTYHFAYDNYGWPSLERSAQVLNDTGADVIALLETDASKPFMGNNDLAMWLSERLNMYVDFGPATKDHTWGTMLLSRHPIVESKHHLLPSPYGELAPAISATVNISGTLVDFVATHMGNDRDTIDRKLQAEQLGKLTADSPNPVVFLGYVTSRPGSRDYTYLTTAGRMQDIDSTDQDRWCEYILYRGLIRLSYARISRGQLSDTELQMAKFRIPEIGHTYKEHTRIETDPRNVPSTQLLNPIFGSLSHGHNGGPNHKYHMGTPKYFLP